MFVKDLSLVHTRRFLDASVYAQRLHRRSYQRLSVHTTTSIARVLMNRHPVAANHAASEMKSSVGQ